MQKYIFSKLENNLLIFFNFLWLGYLILHNLLSGKFWIWNAFSIIPPVFFILFTIFLSLITILKYIRKILNFGKKSVLIFLILCLNTALALLISDINFNALGSKPEYNEDEVITLFNLNTHFWEGPTYRDDFAKFLKDQDADIYLLQEFIPYYPVNNITLEQFHEPQIEALKNEFPDYEFAYEGEFLTFYKNDFNIIEDSRVKGEYFFKIDLDINDEKVSLYNVHIPVQFFGRNTGATAEVKDLKDKFNLRERTFNALINDIQKNENKYFISGDFNSTKSMGVMNRIFKLSHDSIKASNTIYPSTWKIKDLQLWRIDYALASNAITFKDHEYIDSRVYSDHSGILVRIEL